MHLCKLLLKMLSTFREIHKKAIAYYRHSAEDKQENSVAIQRQHTEQFAYENNIKIIATRNLVLYYSH